MEVNGQHEDLAPGKELLSIHLTGGWVGTRASLEAMARVKNPRP